MTAGIIALIAAICGVVLTVLICVLVLPESRYNRLNGFFKTLHNIFNFKSLLIESIMKVAYVLATTYCICYGFFALFMVETYYDYHYSYYGGYYEESTEWVGWQGLIILVLGPIIIRLAYEAVMMFILLVKNTMQINNRLKNKFDDEIPENTQPNNVPQYNVPQYNVPQYEGSQYNMPQYGAPQDYAYQPSFNNEQQVVPSDSYAGANNQ